MTTRLNANNVEIGTVTAPQRDALSATQGMTVFCSTDNEIQVYDGTKWRAADGSLASPAAPFNVTRYSVNGASASPTNYTTQIGTTVTINNETGTGNYVRVTNNSGASITFDMYLWGAGGRQGGSPGPAGGAAGHGIKGRYTLAASGTMTALVAAQPSTNGRPWPDGGNSSTYGGASPGGGSSRIGAGIIPVPTINSTPTSYLLIAGGGGGGCNFLNSGSYEGYGNYPSGQRGNCYYPADGANCDGKGGTQNAGGAGGASGRTPAGQAGARYYGGTSSNTGGSGGGGGWYGGGGAGGYYAHGGGGSSRVGSGVLVEGTGSANPGSTSHYTAQDIDGLKPSTAGNRSRGGAMVLRVANVA